MKSIEIYNLDRLLVISLLNETEIDGEWMPARPIGWYGLKHRIRSAWLAFTGECDLVRWPGGQ